MNPAVAQILSAAIDRRAITSTRHPESCSLPRRLLFAVPFPVAITSVAIAEGVPTDVMATGKGMANAAALPLSLIRASQQCDAEFYITTATRRFSDSTTHTKS